VFIWRRILDGVQASAFVPSSTGGFFKSSVLWAFAFAMALVPSSREKHNTLEGVKTIHYVIHEGECSIILGFI